MRSTVAQYLRNPRRYYEALEALRQRYGDPKLIDHALVTELMSIQAMKDDSLESLTTFSARLRDCIAALKAGDCQIQLISMANLGRTLAKIPVELRVLYSHNRHSLRRRANIYDLDM